MAAMVERADHSMGESRSDDHDGGSGAPSGAAPRDRSGEGASDGSGEASGDGPVDGSGAASSAAGHAATSRASGRQPTDHSCASQPSAHLPSAGHPSAGHPSAGQPFASHPSAGRQPEIEPCSADEVAALVAALGELRRSRSAGTARAAEAATAAATGPSSAVALPAAFERLRAAASAALARAHAPYSGLSVGAALVARDGVVVQGCNVENASYGLTLCAERNALAQACIVGARDVAVVLVTSSAGAIPPCGACRQVLAELAPEAFVVAAAADSVHVWHTQDLLPDAFGPAGLPRREH